MTIRLVEASIIFLTLIIYCDGHNVEELDKPPRVRIEQGELVGSWKYSYTGKRYASFKGIPYAKPPIEELRFKDPEKAGPWQGVLDAKLPASPCSQFSNQHAIPVFGSEDCLTINVESANINASANLPVVLYIHGGAFHILYGDYFKPRFLMDKDVIFITFNYRLSIFGFLSTEDEVVPGNMGMKDQQLAMRWVRDNIRNFGGNPESITLNGASSGGTCVDLHYLAPASRGLFHRGFAHSGTALNPFVIVWNPLEKAKIVAADVGCTTNTTLEMIKCLRKINYQTLINATRQFQIWNKNPYLGFGPVIEPNSTKNPFLSKHPFEYLNNGKFAPIPFITTVTSEEGLATASAYSGDERLKILNQNWEYLAPHMFFINSTVPKQQHKMIIDIIKDHYLQGREIENKTFPQLVQMLSDRMFIGPAVKAAQLHATRQNVPVFMYVFKFRGPQSLSDYFSDTKQNFGVCHGDDAFYLMETVSMNQTANHETVAMTKYMINLIYSYAETGYPDAGETIWEPLDRSDTIKYMEISSATQQTMKTSKNLGNLEFWDSLSLNEDEKICSNKFESDLGYFTTETVFIFNFITVGISIITIISLTLLVKTIWR